MHKIRQHIRALLACIDLKRNAIFEERSIKKHNVKDTTIFFTLNDYAKAKTKVFALARDFTAKEISNHLYQDTIFLKIGQQIYDYKRSKLTTL